MAVSSRKSQSARNELELDRDADSIRNRIESPNHRRAPSPRSSTPEETRIRPSDDLIARVLDQLIADDRLVASLAAALEQRRFGASLIDDDVLVPLNVAKEISGLGKTMIYALVRQQKFPAPYKPGGVATRWSLDELRAWKRDLKSGR